MQNQTGWIQLGDAVRYIGGRERFGPLEEFSVLPPGHSLPAVGARIRLARPARVYLRDFLTVGEARRLEVPNAVRSISDHPRESDFAGAALPTGSNVEILEIHQGPSFIGGFVAFWARVKPSMR